MKMRNGFYLVMVFLFLILFAGCGGDSDDGNNLVRLDINNLGQLSGGFRYAAWAQSNGDTVLLDTFNTNSDGEIAFSRFALLDTLTEGDRIFVTIEPPNDPDPNIPTDTIVLDGDIVGNSAIMTFPFMEQFQNASGFITAPNSNQILADFQNLPDISNNNFIYQGFLERNGTFTPLKRFNFNEEPVSDTVNFNVTTARYILSIEPVPDFDTDEPYTIQPFFTVGNIVLELRQDLTRSSLTPGTANFFFPSAIATIRQ